MKRLLKNWCSASPARPGRGRRPQSFRPSLEALEGRQLLSAFPAVSTLVGNEDFVLYRDGSLKRLFNDDSLVGPTKRTIDSGVVSLTVGTDPVGSGMAAYLKADGTAHEWSDTNGGVALSNPALGITNNVRSVAAGPHGSAFVLLNGDQLYWFDGHSDNKWSYLSGNIRSVSGGTDPSGCASCDVVSWNGYAYTWSETGLDRQLANPTMGLTNNVLGVAAGQKGAVFILRSDSTLFYYNTGTNTWANLGGNIRSVSTGTDPTGAPSCDVVTWSGTAYMWTWSLNQAGRTDQLTNPSLGVTNNIESAGAGLNGFSDVVLDNGTLLRYNDQTHQWTPLDTGVA
jgi:hypothetical protein